MKKHLIVIGIVVLLLVVGLSGCNEFWEQSNNISGYENLVEIYNVTVETRWNTYPSFGNTIHHTENGFYHGVNVSDDDVGMLIYMISGTVKNVAGRKLSSVKVTAKLYDSSGNYLGSSNSALESGVSDLPNTYTGKFYIEIRSSTYYLGGSFKYFENVDDYELEVSAS